MQKLNFGGIVQKILLEDSRYDARAYSFVREGLDYTLKALKRTAKNTHNHVSGNELLEGLRDFTIKEFGPMGKMVLNEWGVTCCKDFGNIVFHLVEYGVLGRNENDRLEDFAEIWSFDEVFEKPFQPVARKELIRTRSGKIINSTRMKSEKKISSKASSKADDAAAL